MQVDLSVKEYTPDMVMDIVELYRTHKFTKEMGLSHLPNLGFIVYSGLTPVCCGFLRKVEGDFAQIGEMVTNAEFPSETRNDAINVLVDKLITTAKALNIKGLFAYTADNSIRVRAEAAGFHVVQEAILARRLNV